MTTDTTTPELRRELVINPACDKTDPDPKKNYGVHGVEMRWYVKGPKGIIQFVLYTNWHLPHVQKNLDNRPDDDPRFKHLHCHPQPADIGYHSPKPMYEGQDSIKCDLLPEGICYYDGSGLAAEEYFNVLVAEGGEALWTKLEQEYHQRFST